MCIVNYYELFKKKYHCIFLFVAFVLNVFTTSATSYYVSNTGKDINSGKSIQSPWKTIERLNKQKLVPGDSVFFKSNEVFRGEIYVQYSGTKVTPIVYTSYGKGRHPVISGTV